MQESISSHFKNIKRKSALEAKEKISSGINCSSSSNKPVKQANETQKNGKILPESLNNASRINLENRVLQPQKRRSRRNNNTNNNKTNSNISKNNSEESEFEIPFKTLEKSKKLNLEETINKKRKREEESAKNIKAAKAQLLSQKSGVKNNAKKNGESEINESLRDENSMEIDGFVTKSTKLKEKKNAQNALISVSNESGGALGNVRRLNKDHDVSEKTRNLVRNIIENKTKQQVNLLNNSNNNRKKKNDDFENLNLNSDLNNNNNFKNKARNYSNQRNASIDKNYISDDVLDTIEETLIKSQKTNKNLMSNSSVDLASYNLALRERRNVNNSKAANNKGINNINEDSMLNTHAGNSFLSTNSTDSNNATGHLNSLKTVNKKNVINESNSNNNINNKFESPSSYIFNKINNNFSFENELAAQEKKADQNPLEINNIIIKDAKINNNIKNLINSNTAADNIISKIHTKSESKEATDKNLLLSMEANKSRYKEPELSEKTLKMITELREGRQNNFKKPDIKPKERDRSASSFSLKFKYEELVKEERELILPTSYKKLLVKFAQLDQTLNFFKISKSIKVPSFPEIKRSIETTYKEYIFIYIN